MLRFFKYFIRRFFHKKRIRSKNPINGKFIINHISTTVKEINGKLSTIILLKNEDGDIPNMQCEIIFNETEYGELDNIPNKYIVTIQPMEEFEISK